MTKNRFMSRQEAADALEVPLEVVDRLIGHGALDSYRIRGRWLRVEAGQVAELATLPREYLLRC